MEDLSKYKILYSPKEGTTGFWGLRDWPNVDHYRMPTAELSQQRYNEAVESCKSNSLEIVNPDVFQMIWDRTTQQIKPGDIFDLPEGYKLEKGGYCEGCRRAGLYHCAHADTCGYAKDVLRLVKTKTKSLDAIKKMVSQYTPEELERRENHVATPTFPELEKAIENLTEEDMRKIQERVNKYLQTNKIPQPEPEESNDENFTDDEYVEGFKDGQESIKSSLREQIKKKKRRSIRQTTRSDFDLGYEAALNEVLKEIDTITPKQ